MASCLKLQSVSGTVVVVPDELTPVASCTLIAVNGSEYAQLSQGWISSRDDADAIVGAFLLLFAVVASFKLLARALDVGDSASDEKH